MQELIYNTFNNYGIEIDKNTALDMQKFVDSMLKYNEIHNLTAITDLNEVMYKHILDSVLPYKLFDKYQKIMGDLFILPKNNQFTKN